MPRIYIDNIPVISFDYTAREKYWTALSQFLILKYGNQRYTNHSEVETILMDCFQFLADEFRELIMQNQSLNLFLYTFWLHEKSIKLHLKMLGGYKLKEIDESEFAIYRRILKLILEQGCDIDFEWGIFPNKEELKLLDEKIQELQYLGTWMYQFADYIAYQKMIEECLEIEFDEEELLMMDWQYHYGVAYNELIPQLGEDYSRGAFDEEAIYELKNAILNCIRLDYDVAGEVISKIKKDYRPFDPTLQTIKAHILPNQLAKEIGASKETAELFLAGLTISRKNKLSIEGAIYKPYSTMRYMFRPILIYNIGGEERALVGLEKLGESIVVLATNAIHWNAMLSEWLTNKCMQDFINKKGNEHDKILEDKIEDIIIRKDLLYCRNIKTFKQPNGNNVRIDNKSAGEIDFIIINSELNTIFIAEVKYNRARYEAVGFRNDNSNFINSYEQKLQKKVNWIESNKTILNEHLKIIYQVKNLDLSGYDVEGIFLINTPTFYMFNGRFKAITLKQIPEFIEGRYEYPQLMITNNEGEEEQEIIVQHPYFQKPVIIPDAEG